MLLSVIMPTVDRGSSKPSYFRFSISPEMFLVRADTSPEGRAPDPSVESESDATLILNNGAG